MIALKSQIWERGLSSEAEEERQTHRIVLFGKFLYYKTLANTSGAIYKQSGFAVTLCFPDSCRHRCRSADQRLKERKNCLPGLPTTYTKFITELA